MARTLAECPVLGRRNSLVAEQVVCFYGRKLAKDWKHVPLRRPVPSKTWCRTLTVTASWCWSRVHLQNDRARDARSLYQLAQSFGAQQVVKFEMNPAAASTGVAAYLGGGSMGSLVKEVSSEYRWARLRGRRYSRPFPPCCRRLSIRLALTRPAIACSPLET